MKDKFLMFIIAGQSNAAGRGGVKRLSDGTKYFDKDSVCDQVPGNEGRIWRFTASNDWELAEEPLHADIDTKKVCGIGPGIPFASQFLHRLDSQGHSRCSIGLIPCAIGGSAIREWCPGSANATDLIWRSREALRVQPSALLAGMLWYQGESDANVDDVPSFVKSTAAAFENIRHALHAPDLPIVQVAVTCDSEQAPMSAEINALQQGMCVYNVVTIDSAGLQLQEDGLHLALGAQLELGQRFADAFQQLLRIV